MQIQIYSCSSTFPNRIQELLREDGLIVEPLPDLHPHTNRIHGAFSFRVSRGLGALRVLGMEDQGRFLFHMVVDTSEDPASWRSSSDLYDQVEELMLRNGADLFDIEELD